MDFGTVVKPLGITVKKEGGKVVETSDVVRSEATREFRKKGKSPRAQKIFKILKFKILRLFKISWRGASVDVGFYCIFWRQNVVAERSVKCTQH